MLARARTTERDCDTRAANDDCINGGSCTRTKYSYDNAFRITGITDTTSGASNWTYGYDLLDRVNSGVGGGTTQGWTYDANGNRLTETGTFAATYNVSHTSNRISSTTGTPARTYGYDAAGNALTYGNVTVGYNDRGRAKTVKNGAVTETLIYSALSQMIETSGGAAGTVIYAYDEAGHLLGEYSSTGTLVQETVWLGDTPVATIRPSGSTVAIYYVHTDLLNTPHLVTRPIDNVQMWRWFPPTFGNSLPNTNPGGAGTFNYDLSYPGQIYDGQAGLHQNFLRDYDPAVGRYVESDPVGLRGGANTYSYVDQDPLRAIDPTGRYSFPIIIHGYWCGPNWTGGYAWKEWNQLTPKQQANALPPYDAVDAACMQHDKCFAGCRQKYPCSASGRSRCFGDCNLSLISAVYSNGFDGFVIASFFWNKKPDPEQNSPTCPCGGP